MCPLIHLATTFAYSPCVRRACVTPRIQSSPPCVRPPRPCARFRQPRIPLLFQEKNGAPVARGYEHPSPVIPRPVRINCILFEKPFSCFEFIFPCFWFFISSVCVDQSGCVAPSSLHVSFCLSLLFLFVYLFISVFGSASPFHFLVFVRSPVTPFRAVISFPL